MVLPCGFHYSVVLRVRYSRNVVTDISVQRKGVVPSRKSTKPSQKVWVLVPTSLLVDMVLWENYLLSVAVWISEFSWGWREDYGERAY